MVRVPEGFFLRGSPPGVGLDDERPQRKLWLDAFDIDRTEVTVAAYQRCVAAKACEPPRCTKDGQHPQSRPTHPVVCVRWHDAKAYCAFAGKRLPSEAEWEKAARGEKAQRYPWGDEAPSCERARYQGCGEGTVPVGSLAAGASPYGALDLAGNVWEWTADWHHPDYYAIGPEKNPPGPFEGDKKVVRGGAHSYSVELVDAASRTYDKPDRAFDHVGFRCARSL